MRRSLLLAGLLLVAPRSAFALPVFSDPRLNNDIAHVDVAGIHFGDEAKQIHVLLESTGWTSEKGTILQDGFADQVAKGVSKMTGTQYRRKDAEVPAIETFRKGAQTLEVNYRVHPLGTLVLKVIYTHNGIEEGSQWRAFQNEVDGKYSRGPLARVPEAEDLLYCLPADAKCRESARNGGVISRYPSVRALFIYHPNVILEAGDDGKRVFDDALREAVTKAAGTLDTSF